MSNAKELYFQLVNAIQAGDDDATRALIAPEFVLYQDGGMPYGGTYNGPDEFMALIKRVWTMWGGTQFEPQYQLANEENTIVCAIVYFKAELKHVAEPVDTYLSEIWEFKDGKAVRCRIWYFDTKHLSQALELNLSRAAELAQG